MSNSIQQYEGRYIGGYRLLKLLGRGGFGDVYLGEQERDHAQAAVKILHARLAHPRDIKEFINEARLSRLQHPHIVSLLDFGVDADDTPFLITAYAPHGSLRQQYKRGTKLPPHLVAYYVGQVASALQYAHDRRIIHRDVKPENMLLAENDTVMLSDFGIASTAHSTQSVSSDRNIRGTVYYMAPEQLQGRPQPASDQYALGIVAYEWLCGQGPFRGSNIEISVQHLTTIPPSLCQQVSTLSPEIEAVVLKALAKNPAERFSTIQDFAEALQAASHANTSSLSTTQPIVPSRHANRFVPLDVHATVPLPPTSDQSATSPLPIESRGKTQSSIASTALSFSRQALSSEKHLSFSQKHVMPALLLLACILLLSSMSIAVMKALTTPIPSTPLSLLHTIETNTPDYQDTLTTSQNNATIEAAWNSGPGCAFTSHGYQVSTTTSRGYCHEIGKSYSDSAIQVSMLITTGTSGALLFRDQDTRNANGAYVFEVTIDGHYKVSTVDFGHPFIYAYSSAIKKGTDVTNTLEVMMRGGHLSFFVNDTFLTQVTDTQYTQGPLTFAVFQNNGTTALAYFRDLSVWKS